MKQVIALVGIVSFVLSMVLMGCASMTQAPKTPITTSNVSMLQGKWSGWTTFRSYHDRPVMTTLEFSNATVPLQGSITLDFSNARGIAAVFPAEAKAAGDTIAIIRFNNGKISDQGTIIGTTGENFLELTLHSGEKMKMDGWFYYYGMKGSMELAK